ncbi:MAG: hypothetical protein M3304_09145, partial [Actinomycetota bacterium]|nr:hypothetical protein [Actinomycetota bacterium]
MNDLLRVFSPADRRASGGRKRLRPPIAVVAAILASLLVPAGAFAQSAAVIDFDGLPEGMIVDQVTSGAGVSGAPMSGSVAVYGASADPAVATNAAIVFDATCGGGGPQDCSGYEPDMYRPELGNVLTIAPNLTDANGDGIVDHPNVYPGGGVYRFDFSQFGPGSVTVESFDLLDFEAGETGSVDLFAANGALIASVPFSGSGGEADVTTVSVGVAGVARMEVTVL